MCLNNAILSSDIYANDRADSHINLMRKQREGWDGKTQDEEKPQSVGADGVHFSFNTTKDK